MRFCLIILFISEIINDSCDVYLKENYKCYFGQNNYSDWDEYCFQTPPRNDTLHIYKESYQDMHYLVGYSQLVYSKDKKQCTINIITKVNPILGKEGIDYRLLYKFGDKMRYNNSYTLTKEESYPNGLSLSVKIIDNHNKQLAKLEFENEYFLWDNINIKEDNIYENGQKGVIVELFGWPYDDIQEECEFLGNAGYLGVKISPPNEHILTYYKDEEGELNPWWYFLQPVSYKLESRLGSRVKLKKMIDICRTYNIRIYSQVVINHMAGSGNDVYEIHKNRDCSTWGPSFGTSGSPFWTVKGRELYKNNYYTGQRPVFEFPAVPYFSSDFHCFLNFESEKDIYQLNYHWIGDLIDINTGKEYVQQRIADFLTDLISIGISGISIINGRHICPNDYALIFEKLKKNLGNVEFPEDFIIILELAYKGNEEIILGDGEYSFGEPFISKLIDIGFTDNDINKIKIESETPGDYPIYNGTWKINETRFVMSLENYNIQKNDSKSDFSYILNKDIVIHRNKIKEMIEYNEIKSKIKIIFSSYSLINEAIGFPDGKSHCSKCISLVCKIYCKKSVPYQKAYNPFSRGYDAGNNESWIEGVYTRIHRDKDIINSMRKWMNLEFKTEDELYEKEFEHAYNCSDNRPYVLIDSGLCVHECNAFDFFNQFCKIKNAENQQAKENLLKNIEDQITDGSLDELISNVINNEKEDVIIESDNILYQITSTYNQNNKVYKNISSFELGECEEILKQKYNISNNETLLILKVEYHQEGLLIPIIEYEIFHPVTKEILNLDFCSSSKINILIPASIDEEKLYLYDTSSDYYTDRCNPHTTKKSTDITLSDRAEEFINNNLSVCEINCEYIGYANINKKVKCYCQIKIKFEKILSDYSFDKAKLLNNFKDLKETFNLEVLKCYYILFTKEGFLKNFGNFFILSIIIIFFISKNLFFIKGYEIFKMKTIKNVKLRIRNINLNTENKNSINNRSILKKKNKFTETKTLDENIIKANNQVKINDTKLKTVKTINEANNQSFLPKRFKTVVEGINFNNAPTKKIKIKKKKTIKIKNKLNSDKESSIKINNLLIFSKNSNESPMNKSNKNDLISKSSREILRVKETKNIAKINEYELLNDYELNNLPFEKALEIDKRNYLQLYLSLLKTKHVLFFTFYNFNDYNSIIIKTCLFLFSFTLYLTVNAFFFTDSTMHSIYIDENNFLYRLPHIIYSSIITIIINNLIKYISLSEKSILDLKNSKDNENIDLKLEILFKCLIIRFTLFFDLSILFLFLFWYYLSCFCAVYRNTQKYLIKDTFTSFGISLLYQFIVNLLPGIFRIQALKADDKNNKCMYKISRIFQFI